MKKMKKGFTIVELVIVIGVIAILSAILIPTFVSLTGKANTAKAKQEVADAYTSYVLDAADGYKGDADSAEFKAKTAEQKAALALESLEQGGVYIVHSSGTYEYKADGWELSSLSGGTELGEYNSCTVFKKAA